MPIELDVTVQSFTATLLNINVKNKGAALDQALTIDVTPPAFLLDSRIIDAGKAAAESEDPPGAASLAGVVTGPTAWSIWAKADITGASVPIMFRNDRNQTGAELTPPTKFEAGAEFTIGIPLNPNARRDNIEFPYVYRYGTEDPKQGKLELKSDPSWVPNVTLKSSITNSSMIPPGTKVIITWHIENAVSGILRGPLPSGNAEVALSDAPKAYYKMTDGVLEIIVGGPMTYLLQAEVKRPGGGPNVQVVKMLSLDVSSPDKYAYVDAHPKRVLPYGLVEIDWSAWGVDSDIIIVAGDASRKIPLTELTLNGSRQGIGVMRITAAQPPGSTGTTTTPVRLNYEVQKVTETKTSSFDVVPWRKIAQKSNFTGQPVGLAVAGEKMALLTTTGLWLNTVGPNDTTPFNYSSVQQVTFTQTTTATDQPKAWLALTALGLKFVVVRQTQADDVQVALYDADGKLEGLPIDLPSDLRSVMKSGGAVVDVAAYGGRAYVVVEGLSAAGPKRRAFSVSFESTTKLRHEPVLESLAGYRSLTFDNTLYALNRDAGKMFRFSLKANGELDIPSKTAPAISQTAGQSPSSMFKQGLLASVGRVLVVLGPSSVPTLKSLKSFGLQNVLAYENLGLLKNPDTIPQDLVYNPQHDRWIRAGHDLEIKPGMVCAFRPTGSLRLWVIDPNGDTYTLTVGDEHLFAHDFISQLQAKELAPFFNKKKEFTIVHYTGLRLGPLNETCRNAGLAAFSSTAPVEITSPLPTTLVNSKIEKIELQFNQPDSGVVTLRYMVERAVGVKHDYVLEIIISGAGFSTTTTLFKRVAVDKQGAVSITEVPGSREISSASSITFSGKPLATGLKLILRNQSPYWFWLRSPESPNPADREKFYEKDQPIVIKYDTPSFSIWANGVGDVPVDVDFGMPGGIESSSGAVSQTKRIRFNTASAVARLVFENIDIKPADQYDAYECTIRYRLEREMEYVYLGDGVPARDGASFYIPVGIPPNATRAQVLKIDAGNLSTIGSGSLEGRSVFAAPNSIAVLADSVVAILKNNELNIFDHSLRLTKRVMLTHYDLVTNLKGGSDETKFFTLGMTQQSGTSFKYSYSFVSARTSAPTGRDIDMSLDVQKGFTVKRVPGAPAWVSPTTTSLMDVTGGPTMAAICVEGGLFLIDVNGKRIIEVKLEGTGMQEAVLIDGTTIYCAHALPSTQGLMISRVSPSNPRENLTVTLPGPVTHVVTDTNTLVSPNLYYNRARAVSLIATPNALFVSHATRIYMLDKKGLRTLQTITLDLPCRLIQVRRGTLPATPTPEGHIGPQECTLVWAVGSIYIGAGVDLQKYRYKLYKLAIM